jgi:type VI secretion system secreted protein Hcp
MEGDYMDLLILDMGDDVNGESSLDGYERKIELLAFSHGVAMQITGDIRYTERTTDKPIHQDMAVTKHLDATSPILNQACCEGKAFPQVDIIIGRKDTGKLLEFMRYTLKSVIISSVSVGGGGGDKPMETVTLNYNKISWRFTHLKPIVGREDVVEGRWDLTRNAVG